MWRSTVVAICLLAGASVMAEEKKVPPALAFSMKSLDGQPVELAKYQGKVVLFVNVASECGLTPQYEKLQALHDKYHDRGLAIVGVPCNQFGSQEPGSAGEIQEFCRKNYGVKFDLLAKVEVNGANACDLYKFLKTVKSAPKGPGEISWNFEKFLLNRHGEVVARFEPRTAPDATEVIRMIEAELAKGK